LKRTALGVLIVKVAVDRDVEEVLTVEPTCVHEPPLFVDL
jgi:hypothetical protein